MEILYFDELESTQKYLIDTIKYEQLNPPVAVVAKRQPKGVGSRNNSWISSEGDLTFSFAIKKEDLPEDLPISSASIYFGFLMKEILQKYNKNIFLKWPNDLYLNRKKLGGIVTYYTKETFIVGIGINLVPKNENYAHIDIKNYHKMILLPYFLLLKKSIKWQEIFNKFRVEFKNNYSFYVNTKDGKKSLKDATLCHDGSLLINNERIYSLR